MQFLEIGSSLEIKVEDNFSISSKERNARKNICDRMQLIVHERDVCESI